MFNSCLQISFMQHFGALLIKIQTRIAMRLYEIEQVQLSIFKAKISYLSFAEILSSVSMDWILLEDLPET